MSFFKNFVARGSQGFVGQSSPNVAHIVEQPPVLNKFFFQNYNILGRESRKFAGGPGAKNNPIMMKFGTQQQICTASHCLSAIDCIPISLSLARLEWFSQS